MLALLSDRLCVLSERWRLRRHLWRRLWQRLPLLLGERRRLLLLFFFLVFCFSWRSKRE